jgi:hypothetical protein
MFPENAGYGCCIWAVSFWRVALSGGGANCGGHRITQLTGDSRTLRVIADLAHDLHLTAFAAEAIMKKTCLCACSSDG